MAERRTRGLKQGLAALAAVAAVLAVGLAAPHGQGSAWDDDGPGGHSSLARRLADDHPVLVLKSSLALLPREAGPGDALFLFPTHRPAGAAEVQRVQRFVEDGGVLALAADGDHALAWADALGVRFKGLPALLPPGSAADCLAAQVPLDGVLHGVCLPSPTTFPDLDRLATGGVAFSDVAYSTTPVFLDADLDGRLGAGDQGPVASPLVLQWRFGAAGGRVVAVADADVWRNGVTRDHPSNLEFAHAVAAGVPGAVFLDSSGAQPALADRLANPGYRLLAGPGAASGAGLALCLLGVTLLALRAPRIAPLRVHDPPRGATDPDVEEAARRVLHDHLRSAGAAADHPATGTRRTTP